MGLFSRDSSHDKTREALETNPQDDFLNEPFDPVPLPTSSDLDDSFFSSNSEESFDPTAINSQTNDRQKPDYGIEDVIQLMRDLPQEHRELVVTVVKKTLESAEIDMEEILVDAKSKEERLRDKTQHLQVEIKQLQQEIETRNKEIAVLQKDLKETLSVKDKLELAQKIAARQQEKAALKAKESPSQDRQERQTEESTQTEKSKIEHPKASLAGQASSNDKTRVETKPSSPKKPEPDAPLH